MTSIEKFSHHCKGLVIASAADESYLEGLTVTLMSAVWSLKRGTEFTIVVLHSDLPEAELACLERRIEGLAREKDHVFHWLPLELDLGLFSHLPVLRDSNTLTYARLALADLIDSPEVIWIDSDMLVLRDLSEIPSLIEGEPLVAGCQDTGVRYLANDTPLDLPTDCVITYLNAGLIWMNLRRMREENFCERIFGFMAEHNEGLRFHDQTAINSFVLGDHFVLPSHFNYLCAPWYRQNEAVIRHLEKENLHYLGGDKPWMGKTRLSCYVRDLAFYEAAELLLGKSQYENKQVARKLLEKRKLPGYVRHLIRHSISGNAHNDEDQFQGWRELWAAYSGEYRREVDYAIHTWFLGNYPLSRANERGLEAPAETEQI